MNFIKRAGITLWARKGRTILLMITASVILMFVMAGLIIQNAALTSAKTATNSVGSTVTLSQNREKMMQKMQKQMSSATSSSNQKPTFTQATTVTKVKKIAALSNVASYNISTSTSVNASGFNAVSTTSSSNQNGMGGQIFGNSSSSGNIQVNGVSTTTGSSSFSDNTAKIISGRGIKTSDENKNNVVIESELATANNLKVGDSIKVADSSDSSKKTSVKIVGIYKAKTTTNGFSRQDPSNTIYASYTLSNQLAGTEGKVSNVTYTMSDPSKTQAFTKAAKKILNDSDMTLTSDAAAYKAAAKQMKGVASFASKIVWVVAIAGVLILGLIILLITRERRREIGILVSLGETKMKVVAQLFTELLIVLAVALGIATAAGTAVSGPISNSLVQQQQSSQQSAMSQGAPGGGMNKSGGQGQGNRAPMNGGGMRMAGTTGKMTNINTVLTPGAIAELGGMAILIALLSVSGAGITILRMKPKKILQAD
ncbi:ABC transporter permease [Weissella paramesenteroides]|uniref:ABC transporter permease n=1 Tax=Weissella paramesenteroides TaxID=1249 RepID=UPI00223C4088|nr:ABC transporter permease [Weissella paramesenteroides]MCT0485211.1 ABC transporter permease [Weissella paramesenteroides]